MKTELGNYLPAAARAGFAGFLLAASSLFSGGCGKSTSDAQVIQVARNIGGREGFRLHWEAWKSAFESQNPGWKMELVDLGNSGGAEYYKARIATGDLPDVVQLWNLTSYLADGGHLVPLPDAFYEKFGLELPAPYKGKRYASMGGYQIIGLAVNKKMWADVGVTQPPASWDELVAGLAKLKAKGYKPLNYGGREWSAATPLFYNFQVNLYDRPVDQCQLSWTRLRDEKRVSFATDPTCRRILENMIALLDAFAEKGVASDGYNEEQRKFYGGQAATWIMGCWIGGDLEGNKVDFDIDYWPFPPLDPGRGAAFIMSPGMQSGWAVTTSAAGPRAEKAIAVLEALFAPRAYQLFLNGEAQLAAARAVPVTGPRSDWPPAQRFYDTLVARLAQFGSRPGCSIALDDTPPPLIETTMMRVMQEILAGNRDVDTLLKMLDDDWDSARKGM